MKPFPTPEALAADESFQSWVRSPDARSDAHWNEYLRRFPHQRALLDEARSLVRHLRFEQPGLPEAEVDELRARLLTSLETEARTPKTVVRPLGRRWGWLAAACLAGLSVLGWWWASQRAHATTTVATRYGETRSVLLPDGSRVTLNAHSRLRFAENLGTAAVREVWLEGEAFFSVQHLPTHAAFRVHTSRMNVEVLGTEFNVADRRQTTQVVLVEGKVRVDPANRTVAPAVLRPGDLVEASDSDRTRLVQRRVRTDAYAAWREHRWVLDDVPLAEVARRLEETFGKPVEFADSSLASVKVNGVVSTQNLDELLAVLSGTIGRRIQLQGDRIVVGDSPL